MTPELTVLALAVLLLLVQLAWAATRANLEVGSSWFLSPRDAPAPDLSRGTQRLKRAYANHVEALVPFAAVALLVAVSGQSTGFTAACAWTYLAARVLYVPAYLYGWNPGRSILYGIGYLATGLMAVAALL
jgi:uncharacterized MAPEG superfamily protein